MSRLARWALFLALWGAGPSAFAQQAYSHRGALGLQLASGGIYQHTVAFTGVSASGPRLPLDVGVTWSDDDAMDWVAWGRAMRGAGGWSGAVGAHARVYSGVEAFKTFYDVGLSAQVLPFLAAGPRIGFGAQYELSEVSGLYAGVALQLGFGTAFHFGVEGMLGLQLRTYLLE